MNRWLEMDPTTLVLARGELAALRPRGTAWRISCITGRLWVTASGRDEDFVLGAGEQVTLAGRGRIVAEALRTTTVRLEMRAPERVTDGAGLLYLRALSPNGKEI